MMDDKRRSTRVLLGQDNNSLINLVAVNVILFLILKFLFLVYQISDSDMSAYYRNVFNWFTLPADLSKLSTRPWTVLTHMFVHEDFFHLFANTLWLWMYGYILQEMAGNRKLIPIYLYGGLTSAFLYILSYHIFPQLQGSLSTAAFFGANASLMAVAIATTTVSPDYRIFPMINGGIPLWVLTVIYVILNFIFIPSRDAAMYIANVGGASLGFLFIYQMRKGNDWSVWMNAFFDWAKDLFNPDKKSNNRKTKDEFFYKVKGSQPFKKTPHITQQRIDRILDKINQEGYHFLTDEEKDVLKRAANDGDL
ncbi:MAG: rhomboid family intramembrane serine protease [Chitinophagaceae bacterium]|nr:rhomboid family intramembrane serine protease [Chitinophagaceae bacterium]